MVSMENLALKMHFLKFYTCSAPCTIKCGLCQEHCCSFPFGREDLNEDTERFLLPCLGREEDNSAAPAKNIDPGRY